MFLSLAKTIGFWAIAGYIAFQALDRTYDAKLAESRARYRESMAELQKSASSRSTALKMETHLTATRLQNEQAQELRKAWGPGFAPIVKDPSLSIAQVLTAIARSAAPQNTRVTVSVDRFTDFEVSFELPEDIPATAMSPMCAPLLAFGTLYLQRISFFANHRLIGELDRAAIVASTMDRDKPDPLLVARSLVTHLQDPPAAANLASTGTAEAPESVSDEGDRYNKIVSGWQDDYQKHTSAVNQAIDRLNRAIDFKTLKAKTEIADRLRLLDEAARDITAAKGFFPQSLDSLQNQLSAYHPLIVTVTLRHMKSTASPRIEQVGGWLAALSNFQAAARRQLQTLEIHRLAWKISDQGTLLVSDPTVLTTFNRNISELESCIEQVNRTSKLLNSPSTNP